MSLAIVSTPHSTSASVADTVTAPEDLGPLAWVLAEIQKSLDGAGKLLRRFARETGNVPDIDSGPLRMARQQLHQAVGALQMVGHTAPARVLGAMEFAVQSFVLEPMRCNHAAVQKIERAGFAVADFLQALLSGKQISPVAMFAQYRDVLELVGNERVHPADLWPQPWRWVDIARPADATALVCDPAVRSKLDRELLKVVRSGDDLAARRLHELCLGLARGATTRQVASFWMLAAGFFEGLALGLVAADVYAKRAASRVLLQYATLARGDNIISERLAQDLLFFCAQAVPGPRDEPSTLRTVRLAWGIADERGVDYTVERFGRFDPLMLAQTRKRIESAKEMWSALSSGDVGRLRQAADTFAQLAESLQKLHPASLPMAQALNNAVDASLRSGKPPATELAMEVATSVLYLEAAFQDLDPHDRQLTARTIQLAGRIERARESRTSEPLEPWMEELYRRVSDVQSMGTVVDELRIHLSELEKSLDQFFRRPADKGLLRSVPSQLLQMRGVFSVLGLDQAAQTVQCMRQSVERMLADGAPENTSRDFDSLGNNLGALGFLNDMLSYQPTLAKRLFVFDAEAGELKPMMGRRAEAAVAYPSSPVVRADSVLSTEEIDAQISMRLAALATESKKPSSPIEEFSRAADSWTAKISGPAPLDALADTEVTELEEDDLQNIFLEEAREVLHNGLAAVAAPGSWPDNSGALTVLRRAFHTLKGSSRMVGLIAFGEAAWAFEQVLNTWLAEQRPATPQMLAATGKALVDFSGWVDAIASSQPHAWQAEPFLKAAEQLHKSETTAAAGSQTVDVVALAVVARQIAAEQPSLPERSDLDLPFVARPTSGPSAAAATEVNEFPATQFFDFYGNPAHPAPAPEILASIEDLDFVVTQHQPMPALESVARVLPLASAPVATPVAGIMAEHQPELKPPVLPIPESAIVVTGLIQASGAAEEAPERIERVPEPDPQVVLATNAAPNLEYEPEPAEVLSEPEAGRQPLSEVQPAAIKLDVLSEVAAGPLALQAHADDAVKAVGPLRIGIALYNVYLNEADEWSRQLCTELGEWALEPHLRVADSTVGLAHSLAGSSATVGFQSLSHMARLLETALQHLHTQGSGTLAEGAVLTAAAGELRHLLHQFAAGFLKEPANETLQSLREVAGSTAPSFAKQTAQPIQMVSAGPFKEPEGAEVAFEDSDDAIDLLDAVDPDLFHVFKEEAAELLPQLSGALRQWAQQPDDGSQRADMLRTLHTLKGSARLAGAVQLGERAHRMESAIELLGRSNIERRDIEHLLIRLDAMQATFESLRAVGDKRQAELASLNPQVPVEAPAHASEEIETAPLVAREPDAAARPAVPLLTPGMLMTPLRPVATQAVRIRTHLLDRLVAQAGEVIITRSRLEVEVGQLRSSLADLAGNLDRLRYQLRDIELQAESQMQSRLAKAKDSQQGFDPLEFDRFTRVQELTRMMAESVNDIATVQRTLQTAVQTTEDDLSALARQTRELQRGLLRTRMVEFEGISDRLYRVVRQATKDTGKQVKLDLTGGSIEMDRVVLDRMTPAFEHLLRNCVAHGIEDPAVREEAGKERAGSIVVNLQHEGNDVSVTFRDDGSGLDVKRITERARVLGLIEPERLLSADEAIDMIFRPGFSTAAQVSELSGRGIGMDVVSSDVAALGGRIETRSTPGHGTSFKLVLPLTTAVTHVVMVRAGEVSIGVPSNLVEVVHRVAPADLDRAYDRERYAFGGVEIPFYWAGALLQSSARSERPFRKNSTVVVVRSAAQRVAVHVDEVLGNKEVVVKNLGPQLSRLPGMAGISVLASGAVALIYNPVALASVHGELASALQQSGDPTATVRTGGANDDATVPPVANSTQQAPLILVVDDSITVRRVTQRLLQRDGYRVALAADGLQALERLQQERPSVVLSDIEMPRMDGFDLTRNIRADKSLARLPIIMITSRIAEKHREHAKQLGVDHYLGKPYSEEELLRLIRGFTCAEAPAALAA